MNVCIIPSAKLSYESGSTLYAEDLVHQLAKQGHTLYVICLEPPKNPCKKATYISLNIMEHPVIDDYPVSDKQMIESINKLSEKIVELHTKERIDVIHAHYATINAMAALMAHTITGVPYIVSCFGRDVFNGARNDIRYQRMVELSLCKASYILCSNMAVKEKLFDLHYLELPRLKVMHMPVNDSLFRPRKLKKHQYEKNNQIRLLNIVSCFAQEKGIETTLTALALLVQKWQNLKVYIIGMDENPNQMNQKRYVALAKDLGIHDHIEWVGQVDHKEIPRWLESANLLIDSRYEGNYSSVILEALAVGIPVIATNVNGNREFIEDNVNGILYAAGNVNSFVEKMEYILGNKLLSDLEKQTKDWFENNKKYYTCSEHVKKLEILYRDVN